MIWSSALYQRVATAVWSLVAVGSRTVTTVAGSPGTIHSIQRGTIAMTGTSQSNTASVTTGGSFQELAYHGADSTDEIVMMHRVSLSGSTVTGSRSGTGGNSRSTTVGYEVRNRY